MSRANAALDSIEHFQSGVRDFNRWFSQDYLMPKKSKTQEPCDCGAVTRLLNNPDSNLVLSENNTFQLKYDGGSSSSYHALRPDYPTEWRRPSHGHSLVSHCPFCGGALPDSSKPIWYPRLTDEERTRLQQLVAGISTIEEAIQRLGPPDCEGTSSTHNRTTGELEPSPAGRNIQYTNLSESADLHISSWGWGGIMMRIEVKRISPRHVEDEPSAQ